MQGNKGRRKRGHNDEFAQAREKARKEKALVDANYLRLIRKQKPISRFNKEKINYDKALKYASLFANAKLTSIIKTTLR